MALQNTPGQQILLNLLAAFNKDTQTVLSLFDPTATVEYPYAKSIGSAYRLTMNDYRKHLDNMLPDMPDIIFSENNCLSIGRAGFLLGGVSWRNYSSNNRGLISTGLCRPF